MDVIQYCTQFLADVESFQRFQLSNLGWVLQNSTDWVVNLTLPLRWWSYVAKGQGLCGGFQTAKPKTGCFRLPRAVVIEIHSLAVVDVILGTICTDIFFKS